MPDTVSPTNRHGRLAVRALINAWHIWIWRDLGLLKRASGIGLFFGHLGQAMMLAGLAWAAWMIRLQKTRLSDSPFADNGLD